MSSPQPPPPPGMRPAQGYMEQPPMQPVPGGSEKHPLPPHQAYPVNLPQFKEGFQHGLCGCCNDCSTCCLGCWCPCILFGRTRARLLNPHLRKEQISCCNGDCMGYAALATLCPGLQFIFGCMNRKDIRKKYDIDGNGCSDCMVHWCCDCCALIQEDWEVQMREDAYMQMQQMQGYFYPMPPTAMR